ITMILSQHLKSLTETHKCKLLISITKLIIFSQKVQPSHINFVNFWVLQSFFVTEGGFSMYGGFLGNHKVSVLILLTFGGF
ncbi:MAG: hypothetical protein U0L43_04935, partial [Muribaculaceae bacterium]|nr:hypothetical protein [Muribaculaceae bacterium]